MWAPPTQIKCFRARFEGEKSVPCGPLWPCTVALPHEGQGSGVQTHHQRFGCPVGQQVIYHADVGNTLQCNRVPGPKDQIVRVMEK